MSRKGCRASKAPTRSRSSAPISTILEQIARAAMHEMAKVQGITDLGVFWVLGQPNLNIKVDREKAARYGLNVNDVNTVIQAALGGTTATTLLEADRQFGVVVRLAPEYRNNIDEVRNIKVGVQTPSGQRLHSAERTRRRSRSIPAPPTSSVSATSASFRSNSACAAATSPARWRRRRNASRENVKLPTGYRIDWAGEFEWLQQAKKRLAIILPITLRPDPGAALWIVQLLARQPVGSARTSLCGFRRARRRCTSRAWTSASRRRSDFISLFGVSVMSGILIINGLLSGGGHGIGDPIEAMFHAVEEQMRPILMMTLSACIGLLPAAISTGIGSQVQRPLATVIVGGMLIGPIMLLVVVPALQSLFLRHRTSPGAMPARGSVSGDLKTRRLRQARRRTRSPRCRPTPR